MPRANGLLGSIARTFEVAMGSCPTCMDRSTAPQPVTFRLNSW
ncbi:hypothetical protein [Saccharothrix lopnurensis]|uniref:Uncharacterized protein n=1 Tax=Saccharothrix lopnurensis TaxID=1670621 RepID=A0ABW1P8M0_9PSEU